jgi:hypothetical protein
VWRLLIVGGFQTFHVPYSRTTLDLAIDLSSSWCRSSGFHLIHDEQDDLATYLEKTDLTTPVKQCGFSFDQSRHVQCLLNIGFQDSCAWIWFIFQDSFRYKNDCAISLLQQVCHKKIGIGTLLTLKRKKIKAGALQHVSHT